MSNYLIEREKETILRIIQEEIERAKLGFWLGNLITLYSILNMCVPKLINKFIKLEIPCDHIHFWDPMFFIIGITFSITTFIIYRKLKKLYKETEQK